MSSWQRIGELSVRMMRQGSMVSYDKYCGLFQGYAQADAHSLGVYFFQFCAIMHSQTNNAAEL